MPKVCILLIGYLLIFSSCLKLYTVEELPNLPPFRLEHLMNDSLGLNPETVDDIVVSGDYESINTQLGQFLREIPRSKYMKGKKPFKGQNRFIQKIRIFNSETSVLPDSIIYFPALSELEIDSCPNLHFNAVFNSIYSIGKKQDTLYLGKDGITFSGGKKQNKRKSTSALLHLNSVTLKEIDLTKIDTSDLLDLEYLNELNIVRAKGVNQETLQKFFLMLKRFPRLQYLRMEDCGIDTLPPAFEKLSVLGNSYPDLISLSFVKNKLTKLPKLPPNLLSLDLSFNNIRFEQDFISPTAFRNMYQGNKGDILPSICNLIYLEKLKYLFLDCNRFDETDINQLKYFSPKAREEDNMEQVLDPNEPKIEKILSTLSFSCNDVIFEEQRSIARKLNEYDIALFMTGKALYENDFKPEDDDRICNPCCAYRSQEIDGNEKLFTTQSVVQQSLKSGIDRRTKSCISEGIQRVLNNRQ